MSRPENGAGPSYRPGQANGGTRASVRPGSTEAPGHGIAILVNANAKRGGRRVAVQLARALPGASVRLTRRIEEIETWLRALSAPRAILAAGGDGTAVALLNALRNVYGAPPFPPVGALPLGTGNAWAHVLGAHKLHGCVRALARWPGPLPTRRYSLLECDDTLTFFAGSGWDAQVLDDYRMQIEQTKGPVRTLNKSVYGYLSAMLLRSAPKSILFGRPHVMIENLGDEVFTVDENRGLRKLEGVRRGAVLYEGMASVVGAATCPEFGFRFRAYPFAERFPRLMNVRVYDQSTVRAIRDIPKLWRGEHPLEGMHDWFATHVRMTFSRPSPLQIAGEAVGQRQTVEYKAFPHEVDVVDWRGLYRDELPETLAGTRTIPP